MTGTKKSKNSDNRNRNRSELELLLLGDHWVRRRQKESHHNRQSTVCPENSAGELCILWLLYSERISLLHFQLDTPSLLLNSFCPSILKYWIFWCDSDDFYSQTKNPIQYLCYRFSRSLICRAVFLLQYVGRNSYKITASEQMKIFASSLHTRIFVWYLLVRWLIGGAFRILSPWWIWFVSKHNENYENVKTIHPLLFLWISKSVRIRIKSKFPTHFSIPHSNDETDLFLVIHRCGSVNVGWEIYIIFEMLPAIRAYAKNSNCFDNEVQFWIL